MSKLPHFYVLGASDPEMAEIENVLKSNGIEYGYAMKDGQRVHPGNGYKANSVSVPIPDEYVKDFRVAVVECEVEGIEQDLSIDHHRPGDYGYGASPRNYLAASSLGQVLEEIGIEPTPEQMIIAASDHCLHAAYQWRCPGVDPNEVLDYRIRSRASHQGIDPDTLKQTVNETIKILDGLKREKEESFQFSVIDGTHEEIEAKAETARWMMENTPIDITHFEGGTLKEAPEAACRLGVAVLAHVTDRDGRKKEVLLGNTTPVMIDDFMRQRSENGQEVYGDPARGYAGAYIVENPEQAPQSANNAPGQLEVDAKLTEVAEKKMCLELSSGSLKDRLYLSEKQGQIVSSLLTAKNDIKVTVDEFPPKGLGSVKLSNTDLEENNPSIDDLIRDKAIRHTFLNRAEMSPKEDQTESPEMEI